MRISAQSGRVGELTLRQKIVSFAFQYECDLVIAGNSLRSDLVTRIAGWSESEDAGDVLLLAGESGTRHLRLGRHAFNQRLRNSLSRLDSPLREWHHVTQGLTTAFEFLTASTHARVIPAKLRHGMNIFAQRLRQLF